MRGSIACATSARSRGIASKRYSSKYVFVSRPDRKTKFPLRRHKAWISAARWRTRVLEHEPHRQLDLARGSHVYVLAYRRTQQAIVGSRRHRREGLAGL